MSNVSLADRQRGNRVFVALLGALAVAAVLVLLAFVAYSVWAPAPLQGID